MRQTPMSPPWCWATAPRAHGQGTCSPADVATPAVSAVWMPWFAAFDEPRPSQTRMTRRESGPRPSFSSSAVTPMTVAEGGATARRQLSPVVSGSPGGRETVYSDRCLPSQSGWDGSTGQLCFGYRPAMSLRTSCHEPAQKAARSDVIWIGRLAGESNSIVSGTAPSTAIAGTSRSTESAARAMPE